MIALKGLLCATRFPPWQVAAIPASLMTDFADAKIMKINDIDNVKALFFGKDSAFFFVFYLSCNESEWERCGRTVGTEHRMATGECICFGYVIWSFVKLSQ